MADNEITVSFPETLLSHKIIQESDLQKARDLSEYELYAALIKKFGVDEWTLLEIIKKEYGYPLRTAEEVVVDPKLLSEFPKSFLDNNDILPVYHDGSAIMVALCNPFNPILKKIEQKYKKNIKIILMTTREIQKAHDNTLGLEKRFKHTTEEPEDLKRIVQNAAEKDVSDIHIFQKKNKIDLYYRLKGQMQKFQTIDGEDALKLVSQIKYRSNMDISVVNKPQDGRIEIKTDHRTLDMRVSSLPTVFGEDFVLRLFGQKQIGAECLASLGFLPKSDAMIQQIISNTHGLVLVTGPTGSGKTTTLYSLLRQIRKNRSANIVTLEDPVEQVLPNIRQSQINTAAAYTFSSGLRAILRQDPDVIMIGEIRDEETAKIALEAAYTGHLVLSTMHTENCESTLLRLRSLNLDPFMISHSLKGIVSQKLKHIKCENCSKEAPQNSHGLGCESCDYTGVSDRKLVSEVLKIEDSTKAYQHIEDPSEFCKNQEFYSFEEDWSQKSNLKKPK